MVQDLKEIFLEHLQEMYHIELENCNLDYLAESIKKFYQITYKLLKENYTFDPEKDKQFADPLAYVIGLLDFDMQICLDLLDNNPPTQEIRMIRDSLDYIFRTFPYFKDSDGIFLEQPFGLFQRSQDLAKLNNYLNYDNVDSFFYCQ